MIYVIAGTSGHLYKNRFGKNVWYKTDSNILSILVQLSHLRKWLNSPKPHNAEKSLGRRRFAPRNELIRTDFALANAVRHITQLAWRVSSWMRIRIDFLLGRREKFHLERQFWNVLRAAINHDDCWSWSKMIDHCCFRRNTLYGDFLMMEWRSRDHLFL